MVVEIARHLAGHERRQLDRVRSAHPVPGDRPDGRADRTSPTSAARCASARTRPMLDAGSHVAGLYGATVVSERHRHRYEFNAASGRSSRRRACVCSGTSPDGRLVEFVERADHPFFVGTQAHPEFKSRPDRPHPLFQGLRRRRPGRGAGREPRAARSRRRHADAAVSRRSSRADRADLRRATSSASSAAPRMTTTSLSTATWPPTPVRSPSSPSTTQERVVLLRQYPRRDRTAILEMPGRDPRRGRRGPLDAARASSRGGRARRQARRRLWVGYLNSPGYSTQVTTLFLAEEPRRVARAPVGVEESDMDVLRLDLAACARGSSSAGEIIDAHTVSDLHCAWRGLTRCVSASARLRSRPT